MREPGQPFQFRHVATGKLITDPDGRPVRFTSAIEALTWARDVLAQLPDHQFKRFDR